MALNTVTISLHGDKRVMRRLDAMKPSRKKRTIQKASRRAMKPVQSAAKADAPRDTGTLQRAIKVRALKRSRSRFGIAVGTEKEAAFYHGFQEWGFTHKGGTKLEGKHFVEKAGERKRRTVVALFMRAIRRLARNPFSG